MRFSILLIIACFFLQSCTSVILSQELTLGKIDFEEGNYNKAFHQLLPIAVAGKPEAEYAVGYMYYYGYGVNQDSESGLFWMGRAAEHHYLPAIQALELISYRSSQPCDVHANVVPPSHFYKDEPEREIVAEHPLGVFHSMKLNTTKSISHLENKNAMHKGLSSPINLSYNSRDFKLIPYHEYKANQTIRVAPNLLSLKLLESHRLG